MRTWLPTVAMATAAVALVSTLAAAHLAHGLSSARQPTPAMRSGRVQTFWPGGVLKSDISYRNDAYEGEYRTFYASGAAYELRHYLAGREEGTQQSWSDDGTLYLNYEVRSGRRYGFVNASPCTTVGDDAPAASASTRRAPVAVNIGPVGQSPRTDDTQLPYYGEPSFTPRWTPVSHRVAQFALETQEGHAITDASLAGRPYVASFVYTRCAAVCPILVSQLSRVQASLGARARILSFSVTPDTDTPAILAAFGHERGIDPSRWSLVTGSKRTIYTLARTSYFADDDRAGVAPDDEEAFLHTEKLLLVDGSGHLRGVYNGTQPHAVDQLIADFSALFGEEPSRP